MCQNIIIIFLCQVGAYNKTRNKRMMNEGNKNTNIDIFRIVNM